MKTKLIMKTPGFLKDNLFYLKILVILSASSIALQISSRVNATSGESIFTNYESLEVEVGELKVKATGKNTTEALLNLLKNERRWGTLPINERF